MRFTLLGLSAERGQVVILFLAVLAGNLRASIFAPLFPRADVLFSSAWLEVLMWAAACALMFYDLYKGKKMYEYWSVWKQNRMLAFFLLLAALSIFWTISLSDSLFRVLVLLFASFAGAYFGFRHDVVGLVDKLFWVGGILVMLCVIVGTTPPNYGIMFNAPYEGSWRGVFWHRNHMGVVLSLVNAIFLIRAVVGYRARRSETILDLIFYIASLGLVYFARSATGYILVFLLHVASFLGAVWVRFANQLRLRHYLLSSALLGLIFVVVLLNLDYVFTILDRSPNLTGRVPLWIYLFESVASQRFWFGHGFGSLWALDSVRVETQNLLGWGYPVMSSDNGYLDILLHLGFAGLSIFLVLFSTAWIRSVTHAVRGRRLIDIFPVMFMLFYSVANLSFSLFIETESFVWMLFVAIVFLTSRRQANGSGPTLSA